MPYVGGIQKFTTLGLGGSGTGRKRSLTAAVGDALFSKIGVGAGGWWILLAFLMAAIWLISAVNKSFVGEAFDVVMIGGFLIMGTLNIWLFIILAVLAGAILVGVIIKPGRAGD